MELVTQGTNFLRPHLSHSFYIETVPALYHLGLLRSALSEADGAVGAV